MGQQEEMQVDAQLDDDLALPDPDIILRKREDELGEQAPVCDDDQSYMTV